MKRKSLYLLIIISLFFIACKQSGVKPQPIELTREHACEVCGMIIVDFPGAKGQIHYKNGKADKFCSTLDLFLFYLQPDSPKNIAAIYVNDMGKAQWDHPQGHWIDAEKAFYVYGGDITGPMGEALVPFSDIKEAEAYKGKYGGRLVRFNEITMDMLKPY